MTPYGNINLDQRWLRQWLVAWRHQAITWTNVDLSSVRSSGVHLSAILQEMPQPSVTEISLIITCDELRWVTGDTTYLNSPTNLMNQEQLYSLVHIDGLAQDCSNSIANAHELLQSCTKPSIWCITNCLNCSLKFHWRLLSVALVPSKLWEGYFIAFL